MASKLARDAQTAIHNAGARGFAHNTAGCTMAGAEGCNVEAVRTALVTNGFALDQISDDTDYCQFWIISRF